MAADPEKPQPSPVPDSNGFDPEKHERPATVSSSSGDDHDNHTDTDAASSRGRASLSRVTSTMSRASRTSALSRTVSEVRDGMLNQRDLEIGEENEEGNKDGPNSDPNLVTWEGPDDPENPKNWKLNNKWAAVIIGMLKNTRR